MAVETVESLLSVLEKSKLLKSEQLVEARRLAQGVPDPTTLAKNLAHDGFVSRWQAAQLLAGRATFFLGKYKLIQVLGRGGMGSVFLAEHVTMNRRVALKIVPRHVGKDPASLERFFAEARAIAALDHPNIVQAYSVDNEFERYFIAMEYVDGQDLQRMVEAGGRLDFERAADYIRQAADGLAHAHARKMVHCDIKPSNLLVNQQGVVKILDLGLARLKGGNGDASAAGTQERALGTVDYLAPEQAMGSADFDHRADIYSLGCTFYFLLTGHPPFPDGTLAQRIVKHQTREPRDICVERPDTPGALVNICRRMMAKQPAGRYQSADEVSKALGAWQPPARQLGPVPLKMAKSLDDELPAADAATDEWWSTLLAPAAGASGMMKATKGNGLDPKLSGTMRAVGGAKPNGNGKAQTVAAAGLAGWLATPRRKLIAAATAGTVAVAAIAGTTALVLNLSPKPPADTRANVVPETPQGPNGAKPDNGIDEPLLELLLSPTKERTESPKPETQQPEVKPEKPPAEPPKVETKQPKKTPAAEKPKRPRKKTPQKKPAKTPPKAAKPSQAGPFAAVAKAIDLPEIDTAAAAPPTVLGQVHVPAGSSLHLQLLSNPGKTKAAPQFALRREAAGDLENNWIASAVADTPDKATDVARVWLERDNLNFQWLPGAGHVAADYLRNCGLLLSAGEANHFLQLRAPTVVEPLSINQDWSYGKNICIVKNDLLPEHRAIYLQLYLEPPFPAHEYRPGDVKAKQRPDTILPIKGRAEVFFTEPQFSAFGLRLALDAHDNDVRVMGGVLQTLPGPRGYREGKLLRPGELAANKRQLQQQQRSMKGQIAGIRDAATKKAANAELAKVEGQVAKISAFQEALRHKAAVHFRVFIPVGEKYQVELVTTRPGPGKPNADGKGR